MTDDGWMDKNIQVSSEIVVSLLRFRKVFVVFMGQI